MSAKDYRVYIANLHAIGCPEATIEDIVRGDTERAFAWERSQLSLDGSGHGPWSQARETQLVASLLSGQSSTETGASAQSTENPGQGNHDSEVAQTLRAVTKRRGGQHPLIPLFLQNANWGALGFTAEQQAAIAQVRQQFQNEISGLNQNPGDAANQNAGTTSAGGTPSNPNPNGAAALTQWQRPCRTPTISYRRCSAPRVMRLTSSSNIMPGTSPKCWPMREAVISPSIPRHFH